MNNDQGDSLNGVGVFVSQDYLVSLHQHHEDWLVHQSSFKLPAPVLVGHPPPPQLGSKLGTNWPQKWPSTCLQTGQTDLKSGLQTGFKLASKVASN